MNIENADYIVISKNTIIARYETHYSVMSPNTYSFDVINNEDTELFAHHTNMIDSNNDAHSSYVVLFKNGPFSTGVIHCADKNELFLVANFLQIEIQIQNISE